MSADVSSAPGSSVYDSSTMFVGDGTWVSTKNTFLLPNLQGLNFATMQLNSMSSRFSALPQYHRLIIGHGVVATLVFLLIVPSAIFTARFYWRNPRLALRLHIYLQILTVALATVALVLGWFAVGPERSLSNPHHGIGVALYTLVLVQFFGGALIHRIEKGKQRWKIPLKLMLHQWLGRAIALLGLAQIPLGMTLYGSPKYLFILYAVAVFALFMLYFILSYVYQATTDYDDYGSYISGPARTEITEDRRTGRTRRTASTGSGSSHHGLRNTALFGAGLAGLAAFRRRSQSRKRDEGTRRTERTRVPSHRSHPSGSYVEEEKIVEHEAPRSNNTWRNRILGAGAGLGAYEGLKRVFSRRRAQDEESYTSSYVPTTSGDRHTSRADVIRVQDGEAPMSPAVSRITRSDHVGATPVTPTRQGLRRHASRDSFSSYDSRSSFEDEHVRPIKTIGPGIIGGVASLGLMGYLKEKRRQRQEKKDDARIEAMRHEDQENADRINRANGRRYSDRQSHRRTSIGETMPMQDVGMTGSNPELSRQHLPPPGNMPPLPASAAALPTHQYSATHLPNPQPQQPQPEYTLPPVVGPAYPVSPGPVSMPQGAVEPDFTRLARPQSKSTLASLPGGTIAAAGPAHPIQSPSGYFERPTQRRNSASQPLASNSAASVTSPPVSVKVKMHNDGRHVTLRRLNEDEATAEREARRRERRQRRRRAESLSSGVEDEGNRFRRTGTAMPPITNVPKPPATSHTDELKLPTMQSPPPVPAHGSILTPPVIAPSGLTSGVGSPGTYDTGTGTDLSAFDTNRRRRRAERAAQRSANQGARVEFS